MLDVIIAGGGPAGLMLASELRGQRDAALRATARQQASYLTAVTLWMMTA
jgi:2-polyprenyl-6-methoxyphenol hydroxylase-like FAD-dependent oxidoreductase